MRWTYDREANAAYLKAAGGDAVEQAVVERPGKGDVLDFDADGKR